MPAATTVAEWAGHSVEVLLRIYAKCLDGATAAMRTRVDEALGDDWKHHERGTDGERSGGLR